MILGSRGQQAESECIAPAISGNGFVVAFSSAAGNLVTGDTNAEYDIFIRDLRTSTIQRVSVDSRGLQSNGFSNFPALSFGGRDVAFMSSASNLVPDDANEVSDIFRRNRANGVTRLASRGFSGFPGDNNSGSLSIAADGQIVAFASLASDLVPKDTNTEGDVFLRIFTP